MSRSKNAKGRDSRPGRADEPRSRNASAVEDLTAGLHRALLLGASIADVDQLLGHALDAMGRLLPFDLAAILELHGDELSVRVARGELASDAVMRHRLKLDLFPSVTRALQSDRAVAFDEHDHQDGDGDPYDGVLDLPHGHHCMVVPLRTKSGPIGALTFDRAVCGRFPPALIELAEVFGRLLAIAMSFGEQTVALARLRDQLIEQNRLLREQVEGATGAGESLEAMLSPAMRRVVKVAQRVATAATPVLISGETGVGKEILARAIHEWSARAGGPLVSVNCATLPAGLVESELFGHVKGAFSGATDDRLGRFQAANGGTLFLDEIGELPAETQAKLLRVLQDSTFAPVGSDRSVQVDVRVVCATNVDLALAVKERRFREDLYYRLNVFPIEVPPLRSRTEDLPVLARQMLADLARRRGCAAWHLDSATLERLAAHSWPGNVRELRNVLERASILAAGDELDVELPATGGVADQSSAAAVAGTLRNVERGHIERTLAQTGGRIYGTNGAAARLGVPPSTLRSRMDKLGLGGAREFRRRAR